MKFTVIKRQLFTIDRIIHNHIIFLKIFRYTCTYTIIFLIIRSYLCSCLNTIAKISYLINILRMIRKKQIVLIHFMRVRYKIYFQHLAVESIAINPVR